MELTLQQTARADRRFQAGHEPVPESGCWLWTGFTNRGGYGRLRVGGEKTLAHRYAWLRFRGDLPAGQYVLHKCDTPGCVNPDHLFLGSLAENNADKVRKGRQAKGLAHSEVMTVVAARGASAARTKLTDSQVRAIRADSRNDSEVARAYGVTAACIWGIRKGVRRQCVN